MPLLEKKKDLDVPRLQEVVAILNGFGFQKQVAFAYLLCERLLPNYFYFSREVDFGNPALLRRSLDFIFESIFTETQNTVEAESLMGQIEKITPDTEDFTSDATSAALDSCCIIEETLSFLVDRDFKRIENISTYGTDTVEMWLWRENPEKTSLHPMMQRERANQKGIILFLGKIKTIDRQSLHDLLQLQSNNGKSNIDL